MFGIGGLGHLAVQYSRIAGASVAAVDLVDSKLALATELGAARTFNALAGDPAGGSRRSAGLTRRSPSPSPRPRSSRPTGVSNEVAPSSWSGLPANNFVRLPIFETVLQGITVTGAIVGTRVDLAETFQLHAEGRTRIVRETRRLDEVNEAFEQIEKGGVDARLVFDFRMGK